MGQVLKYPERKLGKLKKNKLSDRRLNNGTGNILIFTGVQYEPYERIANPRNERFALAGENSLQGKKK